MNDDNLTQIDNLKQQIIVAELIERTKRCSVVWNLLQLSALHSSFVYENVPYDVYVTPIQNSFYVLDMISYEKNILSVASYINARVQELYEISRATIEIDVIVKLVQDIGSMQGCELKGLKFASGGLITGGEVDTNQIMSVTAESGVITGGVSSNFIYTPKNYNEFGHIGVTVGGLAIKTGNAVGFDGRTWSISTCLPGIEMVPNLISDISLIENCRLVFCGMRAGLSQYAINFSPEHYQFIRNWIHGGGRLWLCTEYQSYLEYHVEFGSQIHKVSNFLAGVGSTMTYGGGDYDGSFHNAVPGVANISQGLTFLMADTAKINGGTSVWRTTNTPVTMVAVEQIGNGFLFLCGDGNVLGDMSNADNSTSGDQGDPVPSTTFVNRLYSYANQDII